VKEKEKSKKEAQTNSTYCKTAEKTNPGKKEFETFSGNLLERLTRHRHRKRREN